MNKLSIMGGTMLTAFVAGLYVFMPGQQGKILPDFSVLTSKLNTSQPPSVLTSPSPSSNPHPLVTPEQAKAGIKQLDDGRMVVDQSLPPEMDRLNQDISKMTVELQEKKAEIDRNANLPPIGSAERIIQQADQLIAETERKYGLDTASGVEAILASKPTITDPDLKQLEAKLDTVGQELEEIERRYQQ